MLWCGDYWQAGPDRKGLPNRVGWWVFNKRTCDWKVWDGRVALVGPPA